MSEPVKIGRYDVVRKIARGGMGTVYLVNARGAGGFVRRFALKQCHPHLTDEPEFVARFLDEGRIAARIHHPNVVATIDIVHEGTDLYLVMEYVDGVSVASLTKRAIAGEVLPRAACVRIAMDALAGLDAAHRLADDQGVPLHVTHRDVSPQNILVGRDGLARITDFGIARARDNSAHSREGEVRGKFSYMAPEQLVGTSSAVDARADLFAMGVVLWELLAGRSFRSTSSQEAITSIVSGERAVPPSTYAPGIPSALDAIVLRALSRDPAARPASASEFASALERALAPSNAHTVAELVVPSPSEPAPTATATEPMDIDLSVEVASRPRVTAPITLEVAAPKKPEKRSPWPLRIAALGGVGVLGVAGAFAAFHTSAPSAPPAVSVAPSASIAAPEPSSSEVAKVIVPEPSATAKPTRPVTTHHPITRSSAASAWRPTGP